MSASEPGEIFVGESFFQFKVDLLSVNFLDGFMLPIRLDLRRTVEVMFQYHNNSLYFRIIGHTYRDARRDWMSLYTQKLLIKCLSQIFAKVTVFYHWLPAYLLLNPVIVASSICFILQYIGCFIGWLAAAGLTTISMYLSTYFETD